MNRPSLDVLGQLLQEEADAQWQLDQISRAIGELSLSRPKAETQATNTRNAVQSELIRLRFMLQQERAS